MKYWASHKGNKPFIYLLELFNNDIIIIVIWNDGMQSNDGWNKLREVCLSVVHQKCSLLDSCQYMQVNQTNRQKYLGWDIVEPTLSMCNIFVSVCMFLQKVGHFFNAWDMGCHFCVDFSIVIHKVHTPGVVSMCLNLGQF